MKNLIWKLAKKLCKEDIEKYRQECLNINKDKTTKEISQAKLKELQTYIDKPVICIPNEIDNPVVGIATRINNYNSNCHILVVHDYITNQEKIVFSKTFPYTEDLLNNIYNNDIELILELIYGKTNIEDIDTKLQVEYSLKDIKRILKDNGFYDELNKRQGELNSYE